MTAISIFNAKGEKTGELDLDPALLDKTVRRPLLKEALIAYLASQRQGTHKTKKRGEVAGGGKKPWKQKGTGRARQGSTRSPQWVGGGHAKTIEPRDYTIELPVAQRRLALLSGLRFKLEEGRWCAVDGLDAAAKPSTKAISSFFKNMGLEGKGALLVSEAYAHNLYLSARNIPKITVSERRNLCAGSILQHANLIFTKAALEALVQDLKKKAG